MELILLATIKNKKSFHSVIYKRLVDVIQVGNEDMQRDISDKIKSAQNAVRARENASRQNRIFAVGDKVLVKSNRRLGNKGTPLCEEKIVEAVLGTTILIKGWVAHRGNLK